MREAFREWLSRQPYTKSTQQTQWTDARRLERYYGDLDALFDRDRFASLRSEFEYSKEDERAGRDNPTKIEIDGDLYSNLSSFRSTLTYYMRFRDEESGTSVPVGPLPGLDATALAEMKAEFLRKYPDFSETGFQSERGEYWKRERSYVRDALLRAQEVELGPDGDPSSVGQHLLDMITAPAQQLIGSGMASHLRRLREGFEDDLKRFIGELVQEALGQRADDDYLASVLERGAQKLWAIYQRHAPKNWAYSDTRRIPSTILALVLPADAIAIRYTPFQAAGHRLLRTAIFKNAPIRAGEYRTALQMSQAIQRVMESDWGWDPQDLWDVRNFICSTSAQADDADETSGKVSISTMSSSEPLNLILYGPPGTGKTFETAERAVRTCDGSAPSSRKEVMDRYNELVERKRISFVTFHQSYAYEDFVEGLRPETADGENGGGSEGFSLRPHAGIFKTIAELARENHGRSAGKPALDRDKRVFKVSLGRHGEDASDRLFRSAIDEGYIALGWGGELDWSAPEYADFRAIKARWQQEDPSATGKNANIEQVFSFRSWMREGDLVVISNGRDSFRGIAEVTAPYIYVPGERDEYHHHRPVKWLWHDPKGLPRDVIYPRWFRSQSVYELDPKLVNWPALEQVISVDPDGPPGTVGEPYVLIIDEINRANISKVFGELITLVEKDKRLNGDNPLTVTLPYSGETFGVPSNLHIIGTMNTADRSIALLDTALRRRFQFEELMPKPHVLRENVDGINLRALLTKLNERIEYLFDREHQIGHAYFIDCDNKQKVDDVMRTKVIPLLSEYFYENWEKIRQVLGETADEGGFIIRNKLAALGGIDIDYQRDRWRYMVRNSFDLAAYRQLVS